MAEERFKPKGTEIDLAAINKHHVPGTAYHWRHNYHPLDARTAALWGKKDIATKLTEKGHLTTHEPDWVKSETDRKPSAFATKAFKLVTADKPRAYDVKNDPALKQVHEHIANARNPENNSLKRDVEYRRAHERLIAEETKELDKPGPTTERYKALADFRKELTRERQEHRAQAEQRIEEHKAQVAREKAAKAKAAADRKAKEAARKAKDNATDTRSNIDILRDPKKNDVLYDPEGRKGGFRWRFTGSVWQSQEKNTNGEWQDRNFGRKAAPAWTKRKKSDMQMLAEHYGLGANPEHNAPATTPDEMRAARGAAAMEAANKAELDRIAADRAPEKVSPELADRLGRLPVPETPEQAQANAYGLKIAETSQAINCQKATLAYELRRRGLDASAKMGSGGPEYTHGFYSWFGLKDGDPRIKKVSVVGNTPEGTHARVSKVIAEKMPAGSRGAMIVSWRDDRSRHIFNWEVGPNGSVTFHDAQVNQTYGSSNSQIWGLMKPGFEFVRTDNLPLLANGGIAVDSTAEHANHIATVSNARAAYEAAKTRFHDAQVQARAQGDPWSEEMGRLYPDLQNAFKLFDKTKASAKRKFYKNLGKGGSTW